MQIDVISDTVCPWCYIGKARLARALAMRPQTDFDVRWRPYRLDATIPREGVERKAYMRAKFGDNPNSGAMRDAILAEGESEGITFAFERIARSPNTLDSHRLIRWAEAAGVQDDVVQRLFEAYFEDGQDIGDIRVLANVAELAGMDAGLVADLLESDADRALVEREDQIAHEMGVTGVPTFIFNSRFAISGAREPEIIARVMDKAIEAANAPAEAEEEES